MLPVHQDGQLVVPGRDPAAVLDPFEEPLDVIAGAIEIWLKPVRDGVLRPE